MQSALGPLTIPLVLAGELLGNAFVYGAAFWVMAVGNPGKSPAQQDEISDEELMKRYVEGDTRAFDRLLARYKKRVYWFIFKWYHDEYKTSEIYQEAFFKLVRGAHLYDPNRRFSTWIFTIVRNTIIDDRKKRRLRMTSLSTPLVKGEAKRTLQDIVPDTNSEEGEEMTRHKQLERALRDALEKLNPDQRQVFLLRHQQNMPFQEIAELMKCPVNTAKTRMRYALETLRQELGEFAS